MTRIQLRSSIRWEAVIIALLGTAQGLVIGVFFGWAMVQALADEGITEFQVNSFTLAIVVIGAIAAGVLAALLPARRAAHLEIMEAIAEE